jgi:hypothetical protein
VLLELADVAVLKSSPATRIVVKPRILAAVQVARLSTP